MWLLWRDLIFFVVWLNRPSRFNSLIECELSGICNDNLFFWGFDLDFFVQCHVRQLSLVLSDLNGLTKISVF